MFDFLYEEFMPLLLPWGLEKTRRVPNDELLANEVPCFVCCAKCNVCCLLPPRGSPRSQRWTSSSVAALEPTSLCSHPGSVPKVGMTTTTTSNLRLAQTHRGNLPSPHASPVRSDHTALTPWPQNLCAIVMVEPLYLELGV